MKIKFLSFFLLLLFLNNLTTAVFGKSGNYSVSTSVSDGGRFELIHIPVLGGIDLKLDKFTGSTFTYSDRKSKEGWSWIRNDQISDKSSPESEKITYQILANNDEAFLLNVHSGRSWKMTFGPTGYNLFWEIID